MAGPNDKAVEFESIAFNNDISREADMEGLCTHVVLKTTAAVRIHFDGSASTGDFLLESADQTIEFPAKFSRISALGNAGSGTLYIWGLR